MQCSKKLPQKPSDQSRGQKPILKENLKPVKRVKESSSRSKKRPHKRSESPSTHCKRASFNSFPMEILYTENSGLRSRVPILKNKKKEEPVKPKNLHNKTSLKATITDLKSQLRHCNNQIFKLKLKPKKDQAITYLIQQLEDRNKLILDMYEKNIKSPLKVYKKMHSALSSSKQEVTQFLENIQIDQKIGVYDLAAALSEVTESDVQEYLRFFPPNMPTDIVCSLYHKYVSIAQETVDISQVSSLLKHVSMRMQLYRIPKDELVPTLFGKNFNSNLKVSKDHLKLLLKDSPFSIHSMIDLDLLSKYLMEENAGKIGEKFQRSLEHWEIYSTEEEENFDKELCMLMAQHSSFKKKWASFDTKNTGIISNVQFFSVLSEFHLSEQFQKHLKLLFYSYVYELDKAPYLQLIKSYSQPVEDFDCADIVRKFLEVIARNLLKNGKSVRTAFAEKEGLVFPEDFIKGLKTIGMGEVDHETVCTIFEALQYEGKSERMCIRIEDIEDILEHYGVKKDDRPLDSARSSGSVIIRNDNSIEQLNVYEL